jgi:hypothetical protein
MYAVKLAQARLIVVNLKTKSVLNPAMVDSRETSLVPYFELDMDRNHKISACQNKKSTDESTSSSVADPGCLSRTRTFPSRSRI